MTEIQCLNCKHAEVNRSELSPNNIFIKCSKGHFNGKWKFMKIGRDTLKNCPTFEPKQPTPQFFPKQKEMKMTSNKKEDYIQIHVEGKASEAIKLWETLIEEEYPKRKTPIFISWNGETDLKPSELGFRIGKILAKMGISILTLKHPIDVVEELRKEYDT